MRRMIIAATACMAFSGMAPARDAGSLQRYEGHVPGASVLVLKDGKPVLRKSLGFANLETGERATPATDYRLASVSKQFTAALILLLAEDGKLKLDDPVRKWLPSLPASEQAITLHHLLSHSSGLVDYEDLMPADFPGQISDAQVLDLLSKESRTYFAPGTSYRYSNSGYVLLGLVAQKAGGKDLAALLKERIFAPLHMDNTLMYRRGGPEPAHRAYGYSEESGKWVRTDQSPTSATRGDGGIYSSIDDLAKWDAAWYDNRLLSAHSRELATTAHTRITDEADVDAYGYGWRIHGDVRWHSGESMGFRHVIVRWPRQHVTVIMLTNRNDPEPYHLALEVAKPYVD
ncbi:MULTISPECIES: serine hydrolase domain-containing protein [Dyella]|uniref:Class A beta-lactamase-related serine hydrolase n=2 Tax=Dyella TaxID=231454 RepID=A0A4R0YI82_9GAMM|nr:class A beta-lactamase-related serine hydrolase [Dyella terrae]TCI08089.1 class A beta-lactamase-related serine hydrolase [Dyella soli]